MTILREVKPGIPIIYLKDLNFDCKPCFEKLIEFNNFVIKNRDIFDKILVSGIIISNSDEDSIYTLEKIRRWKTNYHIQFPVYVYRLGGEIEGIQNYLILFDRKDKILFASRLPMERYSYNRVINILKKYDG